MLNYTRKNINIIALVITTIICLILFILLDIYFLKGICSPTKRPVYNASIRIEEYNDKRGLTPDTIRLGDTFQKIMQIADIYDDDTLIEDIEGNDGVETNTRENEVQQVSNSSTNDVSTEYISKILDTNNKWRIKIPKINVDAPIRTGTTQDVLALAVGHFPETTSWDGNVALAGHNRGYRCNFFKNIKDLEVGDKIIYSTENGERTYKVVLNKIIKQTDWSYVQGTNDNRLTLITCVENMHDYRRCIQAVEVI